MFKTRTTLYLALGIGAVLALVVFSQIEKEQKKQTRIQFNDISQQVSIAFGRNLRDSENALNALVAFFSSSRDVTRKQFKRFVSTNGARGKGVQALEWIPRVEDADRAAFESRARTDGLSKFSFRQIGEEGMQLALKRAEYFPVFYIEPMAGNEKALGFDLASNSSRKAALEQARDHGVIVASSRISLVQENAKQSGTVVFAPIYPGSLAPKSIEDRRKALTGFALGVFRIGDLLSSAIRKSERSNDLLVALYDMSDLQNDRPLHLVGQENGKTWPTIAAFKNGPYYEQSYEFGSRKWRLIVAPKSGILPVELPWLSWLAAFVTFFIATLIGLYIHFLLQRREYAEALVTLRTRDLETTTLNLKHSEARITAIVDNIFDGVVMIDSAGTIQWTNPATLKIFDYEHEALVGKNVKILAAESYQAQHASFIQNYLDTGEAKVIGSGAEVSGRRRDGSEFPIELEIAELIVDAERMFLGVIRDITERKKADKAKSEFVSTVSHELRTPLTSIRGSLGLINSGAFGEIPEKAARMVELGVNNTERLIALVNDLLDMEKLQSGAMEFHMEKVLLSDVVSSSLEINKPYGDAQNVEFVLRESVPDAFVLGDEDRLAQVMANILSNAVKFSPDGETVDVSLIRVDDKFRISISDKGPGVPPEFSDRLFDRFTQADSSDTRQKGGTGLGLNITKAIIGKHDGLIDFESEPGHGATFYVELPEYGMSLKAPLVAPDLRFSRPNILNGHRILVIEDDPDIANLLAIMLQQYGAACDIAHDAATAQAKLAETTYDVITLDILLPDKSGLAFLQELRLNDDSRDISVVVVSAVANDSRETVLTSVLGVIDWLEKPIDENRLIHAIKCGANLNAEERGKILIVEDDVDVPVVLTELIGDLADITVATTVEEAKFELEQAQWSLVILDIGLPDGSGLELIPLLKSEGSPQIPVIIFSANETSDEIAGLVDCALVKSQTTNDELLQTIVEMISKSNTVPK